MQPELLIAIVSGLITLLASFLVAMYQSRAEVRKLAKELEEKYTTSLFDKRLEAYPALSKLLNQLSNSIERRAQSMGQLMDFQSEVDGWLSSCAILLTPTTSQILWRYHGYLIDLLTASGNAEVREEEWIEIRNVNVTIGKFLRAELGVFDTQPAGMPSLQTPYVQQLLQKLGQRSDSIRQRFGY